MRRSNYTEEQKDFMKTNYPAFSTEECAKIMGDGITAQQIRRFCKAHKIRKNDRYNGERFNLSDFVNPVIPSLIYYLGYLWGDGYVTKDETATIIKIQKEDGDVLLDVIKELGPFRTTVTTKMGKGKDTLTIRLNSKEVASYLIEMGYRDKSKISPSKIIKTIPENLRYLFWLGFSDADGCFTTNDTPRFSIHGTYDQDWSDIIAIMESLDCQVKSLQRIRTTGRGSSTEIWSKFDVIKWGKYLYQSFPSLKIGLPRKYKKFLEAVEKVNTQKVGETGFRGVRKYWHKKENCYVYRSYIQLKGERFGGKEVFKTAEEAAIFYDQKSVELKGNRTFTNFPIENYL